MLAERSNIWALAPKRTSRKTNWAICESHDFQQCSAESLGVYEPRCASARLHGRGFHDLVLSCANCFPTSLRFDIVLHIKIKLIRLLNYRLQQSLCFLNITRATVKMSHRRNPKGLGSNQQQVNFSKGRKSERSFGKITTLFSYKETCLLPNHPVGNNDPVKVSFKRECISLSNTSFILHREVKSWPRCSHSNSTTHNSNSIKFDDCGIQTGQWQ